MALGLEDKKLIVSEIETVASGALSAVVADYRGLTVGEMTALRVRARNEGVFLKIVRNTLARRALAETDFACLQPALTGPVILAFAKDEPGKAARLFKDFLKENQKLQVKALSVGGEFYEAGDLDKVAKLPSRDEAIALLMSVMKAPVDKFVRTLAEPVAKMVRTVSAVADAKRAG